MPHPQSAPGLVLTCNQRRAIVGTWVCFLSNYAELVARGITLPVTCHSSVSSLCLHPQHPRWWLSGVNVCFVPISFLCQTCRGLNQSPGDKNNNHLLASDFRHRHIASSLYDDDDQVSSSISEDFFIKSRSDFLGRKSLEHTRYGFRSYLSCSLFPIQIPIIVTSTFTSDYPPLTLLHIVPYYSFIQYRGTIAFM